MQSDSDLLLRYVNDGSQEAFAELVRRHIDFIYSSALRRVGMDAHLAKDVTQDVFTEFARKSSSLLNRPALEGWLYTTCRFKAVDVVRRIRRGRERESLFMNANQVANATEPEWEQLRPVIDDALDSLNRADRQILVLRYLRNKSFAELGRTLELTEDAARMRSTRALDRLRVMLAKRGIKSSAEALGLILTNQAIGAAPIGLAAQVATGALSLANVSSPAASTVFHATNTVKIATSIATLALLLVSVSVAIHEFRAHQRAARQFAEEQVKTTATNARLHDLSHQLEAAVQDESKLRARIDAMVSAVERAKAKRAGVADIAATSRDFVDKNPKALALVVGHDIAHNAQKYAPLFSSLGLSPEKQTQVLKLLAQRSDLGLTWFSAPDANSPTAVIAVNADPLSPEEISAQLKNLLGDTGYQAYQDFNRAGAAQTLAQQLAGSLYATASPITAVQGNQLAQVLAQSSNDYQNGKGVWSSAQINWDTALSNAQTLLTPPQMDALRAVIQTSSYEQAINAASNQAAGQAVDNAKLALAPVANTRQ